MRHYIAVFWFILIITQTTISEAKNDWDQLRASYQIDDIGHCEFLEEKDYNQDLIT